MSKIIASGWFIMYDVGTDSLIDPSYTVSIDYSRRFGVIKLHVFPYDQVGSKCECGETTRGE